MFFEASGHAIQRIFLTCGPVVAGTVLDGISWRLNVRGGSQLASESQRQPMRTRHGSGEKLNRQ